jgi:hypothetical protein
MRWWWLFRCYCWAQCLCRWLWFWHESEDIILYYHLNNDMRSFVLWVITNGVDSDHFLVIQRTIHIG